MTTFDKREEGFEKKFAHDEELRFKATARRNKLLGLWAAEKLGLSGADADAYSKEVVVADSRDRQRQRFRKLRKDFDDKGVAQSDQQIRKAMNEMMEGGRPDQGRDLTRGSAATLQGVESAGFYGLKADRAAALVAHTGFPAAASRDSRAAWCRRIRCGTGRGAAIPGSPDRRNRRARRECTAASR